MSQPYSPTSNATAGDPWNTAFLSDRDVSSQVPVNYVPHPGVYLTPACFPDGIYEDDAAQLCLSNLIASQIRRFIIDIYWDPTTRIFGLCPVRLPDSSSVPASTSSISRSLRRSLTTGEIGSTQELRVRQMGSLTQTSAALFTPAATPTTSIAPVSTITSESGTLLYQLGRYQCSPSLDIDTVLAVFQGYFEQSANTIDARLQYLIFNLRTAQPYSSPDEETSILSSSQLPGKADNLDTHLANLEEYIYRPSQLEEERTNLNATWYRQPDADLFPLSQYFTTQSLPNGAIATSDGWPNEGYVQYVQSKRVLLGYGSIGGAMQDYNTQQDSYMFAPGALGVDRAARLNASGSVVEGCFYNASEFEVSQIDNSWAFSSIITTDLVNLGNAADNLTTCGMSPLLNATLQASAADDNPIPYQTFGNQALFSWAVDQPKNDTDYGNSIDSAQYRCAIIVSDSDNKGHWRVADCQDENFVACRQGNQPYRWQISQAKSSYARAPNECTGNLTFDVPRTGLENNYLHQRILQEAEQRNDQSMIEATWINFNSLDIESCWVTSGPNGTCPYQPDEDAIRQRQVLVPAIAAFIVLLLTVLTLLVKCNSNRRNSKIRKRGEGGWDYEGVPS